MSTIRRKFLQNKNSRRLLINLQKDNVISLQGYFPLFRTQQEAINISPELDFHTHIIEGVEYYMPNGLGGPGSGLQFHGDYNNQTIVRPEETVKEVVEPEVVIEKQPVVIPTRTVLPTPTYTLPTRTSSRGGGGY
tara:strand:+ start:737 stop:1141 length:405 start_codon:yes stop_codon:yes gene_type:complete